MAVRAGHAVAVQGLAGLQRALRRLDADAPLGVKKTLRAIADRVRGRAREGVHSRSGHLAGSIRTSVTQRGASIYSNVPYARVQDEGGRVGRNRATVLRRAGVSQYMTKAVRGSQVDVERELAQLLDRLGHDFER